MYIVGRKKLDPKGRIVISALFKTMPQSVVIVLCQDGNQTPRIEIMDAQQAPESLAHLAIKMNNSGRIVLPGWIREGRETDTVSLIIDDGRKFISFEDGE